MFNLYKAEQILHEEQRQSVGKLKEALRNASLKSKENLLKVSFGARKE